jgi:kinesin family protein C1
MADDEYSLQDLLTSSSTAHIRSKTPVKDYRPSIYNNKDEANVDVFKYTTNSDITQSRIDYLEKQRNEYVEKLHKKNEQYRTKSLKLEAIEGQLKLVETDKFELTKELEKIKNDLGVTKLECEKANNELAIKSKEIESQSRKLATMDEITVKSNAVTIELSKKQAELNSLNDDYSKQVDSFNQLSQELSTYKNKEQQHEATIADLQEGLKNKEELEKTIQAQTEEIEHLNTMLNEVESEKEVLEKTIEDGKALFLSERSRYKKDIDELTECLEEAKKAEKIAKENSLRPLTDDELCGSVAISGDRNLIRVIEELRQKLIQSEASRKKIHNQLQELRGNIRVFVRCRPFLRYDGEESTHNDTVSVQEDKSCVKCHKDGSSVSTLSKGTSSTPLYTFDKVFNMASSQDDVYNEVQDLVQSALDGYKVCIFSYGQTGSGKTFTMTGDRQGKLRGIIPRAVEQVISNVILMKEDGWTITVTASMVELYNEELRDLLMPSGGVKQQLKISNLSGKVTVAGLTALEINTTNLIIGMRQLESLLDQAARARTTACTGMNETSSRSHALFMLDITCRHSDGITQMQGGLRLVDLAGSERLDRTGTLNDTTRLKETVNINKSLSCLADVFLALNTKAQHVPFRNSKLTMLLQDCLSGDGKALMFVNVSPTQASSQETACSLRFANQVNQVELGKATKNICIGVQPAQVNKPVAAPQVARKTIVNEEQANVTIENENVNPNLDSLPVPPTKSQLQKVTQAGSKRMSTVSMKPIPTTNECVTASIPAAQSDSQQLPKRQRTDVSRWR